MKLFCHVDDDGRACGAILHRRYPNADVHFYNYWYPAEKLTDLIRKDEEIIFGDITPPEDILLKVMEVTKNITILDHHTSVLEYIDKEEFKSIRDNVTISTENIGACVTVWRYCYPKYDVPETIMLIGAYDVWLRNERNKEFHIGLGCFNIHPKNKIWDRLLRDDKRTIKMILRMGRHTSRYLNNLYKRILNATVLEGIIPVNLTDGKIYNTLFINQGSVDSSIFDTLEKKYDIYIRAYIGRNNDWRISMSTDRDDIDLTKIAIRFGGGGRANIVGFHADLMEDFFEINQCE